MREGEERCFGCGGWFPQESGPTHAYMLSTPGCWGAYGILLAREYESPALFAAAHRFTVDAYALQHPGDAGDRRAVQSVWVHYTALHLLFARAASAASARATMGRLARGEFEPLPPAPTGFAMTAADVLARPAGEHATAVRDWARAAWDAWSALRAGTEALLATG